MIKFKDIEKQLVELLDIFELVEYRNTGVHYISGGFARADYDYMDDDTDDGFVHFTLKWGVQNDVEDRVNTEHYRIYIQDLLCENDLMNKLKLIQED